MIHLVFNDNLVVLVDPEGTERLKSAIHAHKKHQGGEGRVEKGRRVLETAKL